MQHQRAGARELISTRSQGVVVRLLLGDHLLPAGGSDSGVLQRFRNSDYHIIKFDLSFEI